MQIKQNTSRIVFIVFNFLTIIYFIYGFFYAEKSNFWVIQSGTPIIILEFLSIFLLVFAFGIFRFNNVKFEKSIKIVGLCLIFLFVFSAAKIFTSGFSNNFLFLFFILSNLVKFFRINKEQSKAGIDLGMKIGLVLIISCVIAMILLVFLAPFFQVQEKILNQKFQEKKEITGLMVSHPLFTVIWAVIYYIIMSLSEMISLLTKKDQVELSHIKPKKRNIKK